MKNPTTLSRIATISSIASVAVLLSACGGGGGGSSASTTPPEPITPPILTLSESVNSELTSGNDVVLDTKGFERTGFYNRNPDTVNNQSAVTDTIKLLGSTTNDLASLADYEINGENYSYTPGALAFIEPVNTNRGHFSQSVDVFNNGITTAAINSKYGAIVTTNVDQWGEISATPMGIYRMGNQTVDMPTATASYKGEHGFQVAETSITSLNGAATWSGVSDIEATADFSTGKIAFTPTAFVQPNNGATQLRAISFDYGEIDISGNEFSTLSAIPEIYADSVADNAGAIELSGGFYGDDASEVIAVGMGEVDLDAVNYDVMSAMIMEKQ